MKLSPEAKSGILITASLAALLWGLNYLKGKDVFTSRNRFYAVYTNVDGLVTSNPVFMNGYRIGIVNDIDFAPDRSGKLIVTLLIDRDVFVSDNSVARIFSSDLIGTKALRIDLGNSPNALSDEDTLHAELEFSFAQQVGQQVGPIKDKTERLIESIDSLAGLMQRLLDPKTQGHIKGSLSHIESSASSLDHLLSSENSDLNRTLGNLRSLSNTLSSNQSQISRTLNNLAVVSDSLVAAELPTTLRNAARITNRLDNTMAGLEQGQGTLGKLLKSDSLYFNLDHSAKSLDSLLVDLRTRPGRYVHFSLFGKKR
ncbi:MAG: MlaD family protein [Bacteroidota bacterium]